MIFCETAGTDSAAFDTLVCFASQLRGQGIPAVISDRSLLAATSPAHQFDAAPFLTEARPCAEDTIILLSAHLLGPDRISHLRDLAKGAAIASIAYGKYETRQSEITVASRLAYALNKEPTLCAQDDDTGMPVSDVPVFGAPHPTAQTRPKPRVGLFFPDLAATDARADLRSLQLARKFDVEILTTGAAKKDWVANDGFAVPAWHLGELMPRSLAARFDIAVFYGKPSAWARFQMLVADLAVGGATLIDGTIERDWQGVSPEIIAGPARIADLKDWLIDSILPNRAQIAAAIGQSPWVNKLVLPPELAALRMPTPPRGKRGNDNRQILFVPTNGVGLGHAKRCSLVADAMRNDARPTFAAFPSCIGMLTAYGFDTMPLVSRSGQHPAHENDLLNATRLAAAARQSAVTVFDGGYVFDSVMRAGAEQQCPSIWIRRGLWQAGQNNQVALDRQKTFAKIIVPEEAFAELNAVPDTRDNVVQVGPVVQQTDLSEAQANALRTKLSDQLGLEGKQLVVTMLGGGVAADRRAQINMICGHLAGRQDVMHLLVVWPTATTDPGWFQYPNTRVVQSVHASALIPLADLFVSAIGYNSFHEAIYGGVPTIFVPQMAGYMDDQRARGIAAAERDLAILMEPWELLSLSRAIDDCLDGRSADLRENLRRQNLPEPGAQRAAAHILEVAQG